MKLFQLISAKFSNSFFLSIKLQEKGSCEIFSEFKISRLPVWDENIYFNKLGLLSNKFSSSTSSAKTAFSNKASKIFFN